MSIQTSTLIFDLSKTNKMTAQEIVNSPSTLSRFTSLSQATDYMWRSKAAYKVVLQGCDGKFWVAPTERIAATLLAAGYENCYTD